MAKTPGKSAVNGQNAANRSLNYEDFQVQIESPWPPPVFLQKNIGFEQRFYMENRWYAQWSYYDKKAEESKRKYYYWQRVVVIGSVVVPVLVGFGPSLATALEPIIPSIRTIIDIGTVAISLLVAVAAAIESLYTHGDNWRNFRQAAEELMQEKFIFDVRAGRYANNPGAFGTFVERCEEIIAQQNGQWIRSTEKQQAQAAEAGQEILSQIEAAAGEDYFDDDSSSSFRTSGTGATATPIGEPPASAVSKPAPVEEASVDQTTMPATGTPDPITNTTPETNTNAATSIEAAPVQTIPDTGADKVAVADTSGYDIPAVDNAGYDVPGADTSGYDVPDADTSGYDVPGADTSGYDVPGADTSGYDVPGADTSGYDVPGATTYEAAPTTESLGTATPTTPTGDYSSEIAIDTSNNTNSVG